MLQIFRTKLFGLLLALAQASLKLLYRSTDVRTSVIPVWWSWCAAKGEIGKSASTINCTVL